jgi:hypothetical protein
MVVYYCCQLVYKNNPVFLKRLQTFLSIKYSSKCTKKINTFQKCVFRLCVMGGGNGNIYKSEVRIPSAPSGSACGGKSEKNSKWLNLKILKVLTWEKGQWSMFEFFGFYI